MALSSAVGAGFNSVYACTNSSVVSALVLSRVMQGKGVRKPRRDSSMVVHHQHNHTYLRLCTLFPGCTLRVQSPHCTSLNDHDLRCELLWLQVCCFGHDVAQLYHTIESATRNVEQ